MLSCGSNKHLGTTRDEFNWVNGEIGRLNDSRLSKWNMTRLVQEIKSKGSTSANQCGAEEKFPPLRRQPRRSKVGLVSKRAWSG